MTVMEALAARQESDSAKVERRTIVALWLSSGLLLLMFLGNPPVTRTQEARVLETARQMLGQGSHDWLVPRLNGTLRLQKPPLTYWLSAASFRIGRIDETWGRIPTAIVGWLTLAVTYLGAKWLFGQRAGLISVAALLGSYFFFRHSRLAETDAPAMLFVTLAILAGWRAIDEADLFRRGAWFHLAAASTGLAVLSKGAPGGFPAMFLVGVMIVERRWAIGWDFVKCGALLTVAIIALPWFAYVGMNEGWGTFFAELNNNLEGGDHGGSTLQYLSDLLIATAPWSALVPVALFAAVRQRRDVRMRRMLIWLVGIAIPLCLQGNKQKHYLLPLIPPLMILIGWLIDRSLDRTDGFYGLTRMLIGIMIGLMTLAGIGMLVAGKIVNKAIGPVDMLCAAAVLGFGTVSIYLWRRRASLGIASLLASVALCMPLVVGLWAPTIAKNSAQSTAARLSATFGNGPYGFLGREISLPLCWELRAAVPRYDTEADALEVARQNPSLAVLALAKDNRPALKLSPVFVRKMSLRSEDRILDVYQLAR